MFSIVELQVIWDVFLHGSPQLLLQDWLSSSCPIHSSDGLGSSSVFFWTLATHVRWLLIVKASTKNQPSAQRISTRHLQTRRLFPYAFGIFSWWNLWYATSRNMPGSNVCDNCKCHRCWWQVQTSLLLFLRFSPRSTCSCFLWLTGSAQAFWQTATRVLSMVLQWQVRTHPIVGLASFMQLWC